MIVPIAVLSACAQSKKTGNGAQTSSGSTAPSAKSLTAVAMQRSACFGRCPEYILTINSNGLAEYNGTRNTTPLGVYQKDIGAAAAQKLLKEFMEYRVDTCSELYTSRIADMPGMHYTFTINGNKQVINNANFGPPFLIQLSEDMDKLGKVDATWKKISDPVVED